MTAALTPDAALALVATLTPGLRRAAVLDAAGACLAGDGDLVARARRALDEAAGRAVRTPDGLHAVRDDRHTVAAEAGEEVLGGLLLADLRTALAALRAG
jgi:hypothetical protein